MEALVSVITIAYNSEESIGKTIESVLRQSYGTIEYLIIDGASTDGTLRIAESYRARMKDKGIIYRVYSEQDAGIYDAMNKGIALAKGRYIGILNSGDWYEEDAIQIAADTLEKDDSALVFGNIRIIKQGGNSFIKKAKQRRFQTSRDWNHPTMFVRAELYKNNPFLCKGLHDDYGFYLKIVKRGIPISIVNQTMANFCMGGASNRKSFKAAIERIKDRYLWCYRVNGYSRWYLFECVFIEMAKWLVG